MVVEAIDGAKCVFNHEGVSEDFSQNCVHFLKDLDVVIGNQIDAAGSLGRQTDVLWHLEPGLDPFAFILLLQGLHIQFGDGIQGGENQLIHLPESIVRSHCGGNDVLQPGLGIVDHLPCLEGLVLVAQRSHIGNLVYHLAKHLLFVFCLHGLDLGVEQVQVANVGRVEGVGHYSGRFLFFEHIAELGDADHNVHGHVDFSVCLRDAAQHFVGGYASARVADNLIVGDVIVSHQGAG